PDCDAATARNEIDETFEGELIDIEIRVDVGVIVFQRGDDQMVGMIVEKLRAAIPNGGFVLVALQNEFPAAFQAIAAAEIFSDTTDEKIWLATGDVENPGEHRSGGGFTVRAADDNGMLARQKELLKHFGQRAVHELAIEDLFELGIAAGDDIAHNHQIRSGIQVRG